MLDSEALETLSHIANDVRNPSDIGVRVRGMLARIHALIPFQRCLVMHDRVGNAMSRGFVYRDVRVDDGAPASAANGYASCGAAVGVEPYLACFELHAAQHYAFRWHHRDHGRGDGRVGTCAGLTDEAARSADHMLGGAGLGARLTSTGADNVSTLIQLDCPPEHRTRRQTLLLSCIGFCLHSSFIVQPDGSATHDQLLGVSLTDRERDVLRWVVDGKTSWEIGQILCTSERTVKFHLRNVYSKLNVSNRAQAAAMANRLSLL